MATYSINGTIVLPSNPIFSASSRFYRYGDGFFESVKVAQGQILHIKLHLIRIRKSAMLLKLQLPTFFNEQWLENEIKQCCEVEGTKDARVRLSFLRDSKGLYTPAEQSTTVILELNSISNSDYIWIEKGISIGSYQELTKNSNYLSTIKTCSALIYVMAGLYAAENQFDECVIWNDMGRVCEGISSNIFVVAGEFISTPPLSEYCVDGVMRKVVLNLAQSYGYTISEQPISSIFLHAADEIFFTSASRGIVWVNQYEQKKFKCHTAKVLHGLLNKSIEKF